MTAYSMLSSTKLEFIMQTKSPLNRPWLKLFGSKKKGLFAWQHIFTHVTLFDGKIILDCTKFTIRESLAGHTRFFFFNQTLFVDKTK